MNKIFTGSKASYTGNDKKSFTNSDIYEVYAPDGSVYILKRLKEGGNTKKKKRFFQEIRIVKEVMTQNINGIVPILDDAEDFYVMPLGIEAKTYLLTLKKTVSKTDFNNFIVSSNLALVKTLQELNTLGIAHRDVKAENIIFIENNPCWADFGLAKDENSENITEPKELVGSKYTIAPEVKRCEQNIDYAKSDVYSWAKTFWAMLKNDYKYFDGQFDLTGEHILKDKDINFSSLLNKLIYECTDINPEKRPSFDNIITRLKDWIENNDNWEYVVPYTWNEIKTIILGRFKGKQVVWDNKSDIFNILNYITKQEYVNHTYLPSGGGLDLTAIEISAENKELITLNFDGLRIICNPKKLYFFDVEKGLSHFIFEVDDLKPILSQNLNENDEVFTFIPEMNIYAPHLCRDYNDFNGNKIPNACKIERRLKKGRFAIFHKASLYDKFRFTDAYGVQRDAYTPIHNDMSIDEFEAIFQRKKLQNMNSSVDYQEPTTSRSLQRRLTKDEIVKIEQFLNEVEEIEDNEDYEEEITFESIIDFYNKKDSPRNLKADILKKYTEKEKQLFDAVYYGGRDCHSAMFSDQLDYAIEYLKDDRFKINDVGCTDILINLRKGLDIYK